MFFFFVHVCLETTTSHLLHKGSHLPFGLPTIDFWLFRFPGGSHFHPFSHIPEEIFILAPHPSTSNTRARHFFRRAELRKLPFESEAAKELNEDSRGPLWVGELGKLVVFYLMAGSELFCCMCDIFLLL